jgi:hypothetical protein
VKLTLELQGSSLARQLYAHDGWAGPERRKYWSPHEKHGDLAVSIMLRRQTELDNVWFGTLADQMAPGDAGCYVPGTLQCSPTGKHVPMSPSDRWLRIANDGIHDNEILVAAPDLKDAAKLLEGLR